MRRQQKRRFVLQALLSTFEFFELQRHVGIESQQHSKKQGLFLNSVFLIKKKVNITYKKKLKNVYGPWHW